MQVHIKTKQIIFNCFGIFRKSGFIDSSFGHFYVCFNCKLRRRKLWPSVCSSSCRTSLGVRQEAPRLSICSPDILPTWLKQSGPLPMPPPSAVILTKSLLVLLDLSMFSNTMHGNSDDGRLNWKECSIFVQISNITLPGSQCSSSYSEQSSDPFHAKMCHQTWKCCISIYLSYMSNYE